MTTNEKLGEVVIDLVKSYFTFQLEPTSYNQTKLTLTKRGVEAMVVLPDNHLGQRLLDYIELLKKDIEKKIDEQKLKQ